MKRTKTDFILLYTSIFCFLVFSSSFLLMPVDTKAQINGISAASFAAGIMFWLGLISGCLIQALLAVRYKNRMAAKAQGNGRKIVPVSRIGLISFLRNTPAIIADVGFAVSLVGLAAVMIVTGGAGYVNFSFMFVVTFTFAMHCILNGRIYANITSAMK